MKRKTYKLFSEKDKIKCLLRSDRHCCLCGKACGTDIEIAHIIPKSEGGSGDIDNAIPLCFDCHSKIGKYNKEHPKGNKYRPEELMARREQIYEKYTRHLVPPIHFEITQDLPNGQKRLLPVVGFNITHVGDSLPVKVFVATLIFLGSKDLGIPKTGHYSGKQPWSMNPRLGYGGRFMVPDQAVKSTERLEIKVQVTVIDQYERAHPLLPIGWVYMRDKNSWYAEP